MKPTTKGKSMKSKTESGAAVRCSAWLDHTVEVKLGNDVVWQRRRFYDGVGGISARNKPMLEKVVAVLCEAIMQAQGELSLLDDGNRILDGRFVTIPDIQRDVPIAGMRRGENDGKTSVEPAAIGAAVASLETRKLTVRSEHDVALGVAVNANGVSVVKILSCMDELHNGVVVVWPNVRTERQPPTVRVERTGRIRMAAQTRTEKRGGCSLQ
jgi:hypothetical protein